MVVGKMALNKIAFLVSRCIAEFFGLCMLFYSGAVSATPGIICALNCPVGAATIAEK